MWENKFEQEVLGIFSDMIKLDTSNPPGNEVIMIDYIKNLLDRENITYEILAKDAKRANIIAKIEGGEKTPLIFMSHVDVVEAGKNWTKPAFSAHLEDGFLYGRGTLDTKHLTAISLFVMLKVKQSEKIPNRPIYFLATADEEKGSNFGMKYISEEHREKLPSGYTLNEGGGFVIMEKGEKFRTISCGEKGNCAVRITIKDCKHKFLILSQLFQSLSDYKSDEIVNEVNKKFLEVSTKDIESTTLKNLWDYTSHHSLVINKFELNNHQKEISIDITFKFLPQLKKEEVYRFIEEILAAFEIDWEIISYMDGFQCDMRNEFIELIDRASRKYDPDTTLIPMYALGNTDGRFLAHDVFGYTPLLSDVLFRDVLKMVHQDDERISLESLFYCAKVIYEITNELIYD